MTAIELLESALKITRRRQMTRGQLLVLIALVRAGRPMQMYELVEATNEIRQMVYKAIEVIGVNNYG